MGTNSLNILIGGTSHAGKSTLAKWLSERLTQNVISTDSLARHPGRPWPDVRPHVAEFYKKLSSDSIYTFLLHHHENMWPTIETLLTPNQESENGCILEGSALRPEYMATLSRPDNIYLCLYAPADFLRQRVYNSSSYGDLSTDHQLLIDVFLERTIRDNDAVYQSAKHHAIDCINVSKTDQLEQTQAKILELAKA